MNPDNQESMLRYFFVEVVEAALNMALAADPAVLKRLKPYQGRVIKVKTQSPDLSFFVTITAQGLRFSLTHEGAVDVRVRLPMSALVKYLIGIESADMMEAESSIRLSGDQAVLDGLTSIVVDYNLWNLVKLQLQRWVPEFANLDDFLASLRSQDSAWLARLEHLPQLVNQNTEMLRQQAQIQQQQLEEIRAINAQLAADRRAQQVSTWVGLCFIVLAALSHSQVFVIPALQSYSLDTLILLVLALVLLLPRAIGRN